MCVAIVAKAGFTPERKVLKYCFDKNNDGCGYAFAKDGKVCVRRFLIQGFNKFWRSFQKDRQSLNQNDSILIHFRKKSAGDISIDNCHPFLIGDAAAIHNGTLGGKWGDHEKSDTRHFCEEILSQLPEGFYHNSTLMSMLASYIKPSKMALLDFSGAVFILNADKWVEDGKNLYSNSDYKPAPPKVVTTTEAVLEESKELTLSGGQCCECCGTNLVGRKREWCLPSSLTSIKRYVCCCYRCSSRKTDERIPFFAHEVIRRAGSTHDVHLKCIRCGSRYEENSVKKGCPSCDLPECPASFLTPPVCAYCDQWIKFDEIPGYLFHGMHRECWLDFQNDEAGMGIAI